MTELDITERLQAVVDDVVKEWFADKIRDLARDAKAEIERLRRTAGETGPSFRDIKDEINGAPV